MSTLFVVMIAAIGGVAVALQGQMMGVMDRQLGTMESVFITYALGGVLAALLMLLFWRGSNIGNWHQLPWWAFTSGVLGLVIVSTIGYAIGQLGTVSGFAVIVAMQFLVAALIDHFGLMGAAPRPIDLQKMAGMATLVVGMYLTLKS